MHALCVPGVGGGGDPGADVRLAEMSLQGGIGDVVIGG